MRALLVQPPFAQLNSPYPAIHYLAAFLESRGVEAECADHSIELYRGLFSREGLAPVFEAARSRLAGSVPVEEEARSQLERYLSYEALYVEWVGPLLDFLSGMDPAFACRLAQAVELPRGMRASAFLEARSGRIAEAEAGGLATAVLADLGDLVTYAYDASFGTVRYGERIASGARVFARAARGPRGLGPPERALRPAPRGPVGRPGPRSPPRHGALPRLPSRGPRLRRFRAPRLRGPDPRPLRRRLRLHRASRPARSELSSTTATISASTRATARSSRCSRSSSGPRASGSTGRCSGTRGESSPRASRRRTRPLPSQECAA